MIQIDLEGKRAVVTGGAQGIDRAVAEHFLASVAAEISGAGTVHVFTTDIAQAAGPGHGGFRNLPPWAVSISSSILVAKPESLVIMTWE